MTVSEFADYIEKRGSMVVTKDSSVFIKRLTDIRVSDHIISYENSVLEKKYPDFMYLMNEFHDGMLLFEISEKNVWNRVSSDSAGLHLFYEDHKNNWLSKKGIEASIYTLKSNEGEQLLASAITKYYQKPDLNDLLIKKFNKKIDTLLIIKDSTWFKGDNAEIDRIDWVPGPHSLTGKGFPSIILIKKVIEPTPLKFNDVVGEVMTGYQEYLESEWIKQLNKRYSVKIDNLVLDEVKKKLKNA
jgi:peptidyl-prolyl cis-trans isomerase SurA